MKNALLFFLFIPCFIHGQSKINYIEVKGISEKQIEPDRIELTIIFNEKQNIKKESDFKEIDNKLKKTLEDFNIPIENLTVNKILAQGNYYSSYKTSQRIRFRKVYKMKIANLEMADPIIFKLFEIGADDVNLTNLESDQLENVRKEALKEALLKAQQKAILIAEQLNINLGKAISVEEFSPESFDSFPDRYAYLKNDIAIGYGGHRLSLGINESGPGLDKIELIYIVNVRFEIITSD
jgi:hypothetical protein